jgi:hypothetical protein
MSDTAARARLELLQIKFCAIITEHRTHYLDRGNEKYDWSCQGCGDKSELLLSWDDCVLRTTRHWALHLTLAVADFASSERAAQKEEGWKDATKELPRAQQFVLGFFAEDDMDVMWYDGENWHGPEGGAHVPTHWRELPSPPLRARREG